MQMTHSILLTVVLAFLLQALVGAQSVADQMAEKEEDMDHKCLQEGIDRRGGTSAPEMHSMFTATKLAAIKYGKRFRRRLLRYLNKERKIDEDPVFDSCGKNIYTCDSSDVYRTANGSCNNLKHPEWGQSNIPMRRYLPAEYGDAMASPKVKDSRDGPLKSARKISTDLFTESDSSTEATNVTHMAMQFAQFLDHDITSTAIQKGEDEATVTCCEEDVPKSAQVSGFDAASRPKCFPITIPKGDRRFKRSCMNFVRSVQVPNSDCNTVPVEQINQITAFVDASMVYGSSAEESLNLRTLKGGLLKVTKRRNLLPENSVKDCATFQKPNFCFLAGDERVNEQMGLTSMHTIWMREHNRIATKLAVVNKHWKDERLFQETRRIVGAQMQHITYAEFLPLILNKSYIEEYNLTPTEGNKCKTLYNATVDPSIRNSFATAAFRFGHSMIQPEFTHSNKNFKSTQCLRLRESFGNTSIIISSRGDAINTLTRGLVTDSAQSVDRHVSSELSDFLFEDEDGNSLDLLALNIQRGRDHALPGYNKWREFCGLTKASTFNGKKGLVDHTKKVASTLRKLYRRPDDIDLFAGGVSEKPVPGGLLGPTFSCIVAKQFQALKIGDRFWYETCDKPVKFKPGQLRQLHRSSLASLICRNTNTVKIQPNVFRKASSNVVKCNKIPNLNLNPWKETSWWSDWCEWSPCQNGRRTRTRVCNNSNKCPGPKKETESCQMCSWSKWSVWGKCEKGCKSRIRTCSCKSCGSGKSQQWKKCANWRKALGKCGT